MKEKNVEVLILGNSHTFFGLNPFYFKKKAINVANKSRKLETDYFILKKNISNFNNIKAIILPISSYTLFTEEITNDEKRLYYHFYELDNYSQGILANSLLLNDSFKELVENAIVRKVNVSLFGWRASKESYKYDLNIIGKRIGNPMNKISRKSIIEKNIIFLEEIIKICSEKNIKLFILLPPYHPDFYKFSNEIYDKFIKSTLKKIDLKKSKIIDGMMFKITEDKYFKNVDHLNENGSTVFSKKVDSIINLIIE
ncbi:hypothetical protein H9I45_03425 [Polaribacter haliotis]|uniref:SGNH/GDSL hydrolase family protein n=1 Tax=Polaribacter haliotis TaxID=1888915 RepID=A0A7L8AHV6_9FLAO|nr:hypothetical protein [Polaribacter haliotis]QOD61514.1 hypothetical protein H9I45_03425 [Polaribacter haliotis]